MCTDFDLPKDSVAKRHPESWPKDEKNIERAFEECQLDIASMIYGYGTSLEDAEAEMAENTYFKAGVANK